MGPCEESMGFKQVILFFFILIFSYFFIYLFIIVFISLFIYLFFFVVGAVQKLYNALGGGGYEVL